MNKLKQLSSLTIFFFLSSLVFGEQTGGAPEKMDAMRAGGKIYVVMVVVITILAGLILYVYRLDRKITKFEKEEKL